MSSRVFSSDSVSSSTGAGSAASSPVGSGGEVGEFSRVTGEDAALFGFERGFQPGPTSEAPGP